MTKMKKLTKIKLINWHYLANETISISGNCLITGENGAGKSTILDAIQYVLTAGKQLFNSAANEKAKRNLIGYVRCKTGRDLNQYERDGDVTAHISLEFFDDSKNMPFLIGAVIDSASNLSTPKVNFYRIEATNISESLYLQDNDIPRNITNFKATIKNLNAKILTTQTEARKDYRHRFGSLNERFFDLLPKALAFRPINNIKDFVYSYLLDEKDVDIEYLKENIHTLREYEKYLQRVKEKLSHLEEIHKIYQELTGVEENIKIQDYIIKKALQVLNLQTINEKIQELNEMETKIDFKEKKLTEIKDKINSSNEHRINLENSLKDNDTYKLITELDKKIQDIKLEIDELKNKEKKLDLAFIESYDIVNKMNEAQIKLPNMEPFYAFKQKKITEENLTELINNIKALNREIEEDKFKLHHEKATLEVKKDEKQIQLENVEKDIKTLNSKKLVYPTYVVKLKKAIHDGLEQELGISIAPKIFCELLNVKDERWQNALEGYLNTQRFNLIVDPVYFDNALQIYERVKYRLNIHTVGLVNTKKLIEQSCDEASLAYMVTSKNQYATYYVNLLLNRVIRCENVDELKNHPVSITPSCMIYKNKTVRQIKEEVYKTPYIGQNAYKKQLELKLCERDLIQETLSDYRSQIDQCTNTLNLYRQIKLDYILDNIDVKLSIQSKENKRNDLLKKLAEIDRSTFLDMQEHINKIKKEIQTLQTKETEISKELHNLGVNQTVLNNKINELKDKSAFLSDDLNQVIDAITDVLTKAENRYQEAISKYRLDQVNTNYERQRSGSYTRANNLLTELQTKQRDFNRVYDFGAALGAQSMETYYMEYKNLNESKVIEYEEKIRESKEKAEEQFKDEFISKLQENIIMAQTEFKKLNTALKGIYFGEDEYKFEYAPGKQNEKFYKMIMDDSNLGGNTLFSGSFRERHQEALDAIFERISLNDEQSQKALEEYTDYRTYMDYDIKILHRNGTTSSFSKVGREKSGGETQTPYYVAIAASFIQLYRSSNLGDSIGIILFDEAFDKMDENRIESMMEFLNKLDLQVILASPPQKIETIGPFVDTNLVVYRDGNISYVEAFHYEGI